MTYQGVLKKMTTAFLKPIQYYLVFENDFLCLNQLLSKTICITFVKHQCLNCKSETPIYRQGFCKSCFFEIPQAASWILKPELSTAHINKEDRDLAYEKRVQLQPHIVYLANTGHIKVGVTRKSQIPTRWIDQGAHKAIEIAEVPNRYLAGITEVALKAHISSQTNWRTMLKIPSENENLMACKARMIPYVPHEIERYLTEKNTETVLTFPIYKYPKHPRSLNLYKAKHYTGKLVGIKGQYLIFDDDTVFNIRANEGLVIRINML